MTSMKKIILSIILLILIVPSISAFSTTPQDYFFWDDGDSYSLKGGTTVTNSDGDDLTDNDWSIYSGASLKYDNDGNYFGSLSIHSFGDGTERGNTIDFGADYTGKTAQITCYDDGDASAYAQMLNIRSSTPAYVGMLGIRTATSGTHYAMYVNGSWFASMVARSNGWHNFTIEVQTVKGYDAFYIDDTLVTNITNSPEQMKTINLYLDNDGTPIQTDCEYLMVWNGTKQDIPTAATPPVAPSFTLTASDLYDGTALSSFTITLRNATDSITNSTTSGSITYNNLSAIGIYDIEFYSNENGGYFNRTYDSLTSTGSFDGEIYQAVMVVNATEVITNTTISSFNVTVPLQQNQSNATGYVNLLLKAGDYNISGESPNYQVSGGNFSVQAMKVGNYTLTFGKANLTVKAVDTNGDSINSFNSSMIQLSTGLSETKETGNGQVVFKTIYDIFNVTLNNTAYSFDSQAITIASGNTLPNVTFNLHSLNSINISIFDEDTNHLLNGTLVTLVFDHELQKFTNTTLSGYTFPTNMYDGLWSVLASTATHTQREYIFTIVPQTSSYLTIYLSNNTGGELKTFTVKNKLDETVSGASVIVSNKVNNTYVTVAEGVTNFAGQVNIFLSSTNSYRFTVEANDYTTKVFNLIPVASSYNIILDPTDTIDFTTFYNRFSYAIIPQNWTLRPQESQNFSLITSSDGGYITYFGLNSSFNNESKLTNVSGSVAGGTASIYVNTSAFNATSLTVEFFIKAAGIDEVRFSRRYTTTGFITAGNYSAANLADKYRDTFSALFKSILVVFAAVAVILSLSEVGVAPPVPAVAGAIVIIAGAVYGWVSSLTGYVVGVIIIGMFFLRRGD